ncbi:hypothetical protein ACOSQ3_012965 [Xanthoceras sorbifolium]
MFSCVNCVQLLIVFVLVKLFKRMADGLMAKDYVLSNKISVRCLGSLYFVCLFAMPRLSATIDGELVTWNIPPLMYPKLISFFIGLHAGYRKSVIRFERLYSQIDEVGIISFIGRKMKPHNC